MNRILFLILFILPYLALSATDGPFAESVFVPPGNGTSTAKKTTEAVITDFLQEVKAKSPVLYGQWENLSERELLKRVLGGLMQPTTPEVVRMRERVLLVHPAVSIAKNRILYVRIESLKKQAADCLIEDCTNAGHLSVRRPVCLILDFRMANGGDYGEIKKVVSFFAEEKSYFHNRPIAVLTSEQTSGPAEMVTLLLEKNLPHCITIGKPGCGKIFPETEIVVRGQKVSVPVIPEEQKNMVPCPHEPMLLKETNPMIGMDELGNEDALQNDPALRCAIDMLCAIRALN